MEYPEPVDPTAAVVKHVGETVREVFPGLSERQVAEVVRACGADVDRCLQHILDRPHLFLSPTPQQHGMTDHGHRVDDSSRPPTPSKPVTSSPSAASSSASSSSTSSLSSSSSSNKKADMEQAKEKEEGSSRSKYETLTPAEHRRRKHEFADLNNAFADIMSGAQTGEVIFKGQFKGAKSKVITSAASSQQEDGGEEEQEGDEVDTDLVLARALQAIEDDAYRTMKRREEEDERYARELAQSEQAGEPAISDHAQTPTPTPTERGSRRRRLLISSTEGSQDALDSTSAVVDGGEAPTKGWRELVRQDSLTERDRRLALQLIADEEREKRKREEDDEALARALSGDGDGVSKDIAKRRRINAEDGATDMTSDELIVQLLQEEEEEKQKQAKRAKKEEAMSRKLIEKLMRVEKEMEHDEWVKGELAQIEAREAEESMTTGKKKKASKKWPGFGFGWGDKERMKAKLKPTIAGDTDWKSTRFFMDTHVLEGFLHTCASSHGIVTITNVMKSDLIGRFDRKWSEFKATYGNNAAESQTTLAFHGTQGDLIPSITNKGLLVPGTAPGVEHVTDSGWYGCGIYLSPNPATAGCYAADGKMLVCAVLMGRTYNCPDRMDGESCMLGYDSHTSPCGEELVLFDAAQVLPCYLINFSSE